MLKVKSPMATSILQTGRTAGLSLVDKYLAAANGKVQRPPRGSGRGQPKAVFRRSAGTNCQPYFLSLSNSPITVLNARLYRNKSPNDIDISCPRFASLTPALINMSIAESLRTPAL